MGNLGLALSLIHLFWKESYRRLNASVGEMQLSVP